MEIRVEGWKGEKVIWVKAYGRRSKGESVTCNGLRVTGKPEGGIASPLEVKASIYHEWTQIKKDEHKKSH